MAKVICSKLIHDFSLKISSSSIPFSQENSTIINSVAQPRNLNVVFNIELFLATYIQLTTKCYLLFYKYLLKTYAALPLLPSPPYFELPSCISNFPTQIATILESSQSSFHNAFTYSFIHPSTQQVCGENLPRAKHSPRYKENISE